MTDTGTRAPDLVLPADHPEVDNLGHRSRRAGIARTGEAWRPGQPLPVIEDTDAVCGVSPTISEELRRLRRDHRAEAPRGDVDALDLPTGHVPRRRELIELHRPHVAPVAGLAPLRADPT
ncbi:MAG: hypothetical protein AAFZ07_06575 [Actinomycetota bacterium]